jgi:putative heme-binding domain-containing protein
LSQFLAKLSDSRRDIVQQTERLMQEAIQVAATASHDLDERTTAIRLLAHAPWSIAEPALVKLLHDDPRQEIRLAAVNALAGHAQPAVAELLMKPWRNYTPALRREVTDAMLRQPERVRFLLNEIEAGRVKPGDIEAPRARQLVTSKLPDIRDRARKLLQDNLPAERKQVLERYRAALKLHGNGERGRAIFQKNCATCHQIAGIGTRVGPDISDTRTKTAEMLLTDILNPNQAIDNNFINYFITTKAGKSLSGIIAVETASSITLQRAENQTDVVLRQDIDEIQSSGISLMPEGLEKNITVAEMADLLTFLKNWRYLDGTVPLGEPKAKPQ